MHGHLHRGGPEVNALEPLHVALRRRWLYRIRRIRPGVWRSQSPWEPKTKQGPEGTDCSRITPGLTLATIRRWRLGEAQSTFRPRATAPERRLAAQQTCHTRYLRASRVNTVTPQCATGLAGVLECSQQGKCSLSCVRWLSAIGFWGASSLTPPGARLV